MKIDGNKYTVEGATHLLDEFEQVVRLLQFLQHLIDIEHAQDAFVDARLFHYLAPVLVDGTEASTLFGHLGHDVGRGEDRFQVEPRRLDLEPFI